MSLAPRVGIVDSGVSAGSLAADLPAAAFILGSEGVEQHPPCPDQLGHGSAVQAIIAQLCPQAQFRVAQVFQARASTTAAQVAAAIDWLCQTGVDVINLSLGLRSDRLALQQACARAHAAGVVLCAASPAQGAAVFPSAYPGVLRMTGDARCARGQWSWLNTAQADFGGHVAPLSGDRMRRGASMGCAHMTGHVARLLAQGDSLNPEQLVAALRAGAAFVGPERRTH